MKKQTNKQTTEDLVIFLKQTIFTGSVETLFKNLKLKKSKNRFRVKKVTKNENKKQTNQKNKKTKTFYCLLYSMDYTNSAYIAIEQLPTHVEVNPQLVFAIQ